MAKKKKTRREARLTECILNDDELKFFYEKILLFYENDNKNNYGDFDKIKKNVKKNKDLEIYDFIYDDYKKKMKEPQDNTFYFSAEAKGGKGNKKVCEKFFGHIRNAFAHNYITKEDGFFIMRDYESTLSSVQTFYVKLTLFDSFKKLIENMQTYITNK